MKTLLLILFPLFVSAQQPLPVTPDTVWADPITITQSGDYYNLYAKTKNGQNAFNIQADNVRLFNCAAWATDGRNAYDINGYRKVEFHNCVAKGTYGTGNEQPGRAFFAYRPRRLVIEHCQINNLNGAIIQQEDDAAGGALMDSIIIRYNSFRGITKVKADGSEGGAHAHSIQLNAIHNSNSILIYGNRCYGVAGESNEDIINVNESYTVDGKYIDIYNNLLTGAYIYPIDRTDGYSGSGFTIETASKHVRFHNNVVLDCMNALVNISEGGPTNNDNIISENYLVSAGIPRGAENLRPWAYWAGAAIYYYNSDSGRNNFIINNTMSYVSNRSLGHFFPSNGLHTENNYQRPTYSSGPPPGVPAYINRMPLRPNSATVGYNTFLTYKPTKATEDSAIARWDAAIIASGNYVGITGTPKTTPPAKPIIIIQSGITIQVKDTLNGRAITIAADSTETGFKLGTMKFTSGLSTVVKVLKNPTDETLFTLVGLKPGKCTITVSVYPLTGIMLKKTFTVEVKPTTSTVKPATGFNITLLPD